MGIITRLSLMFVCTSLATCAGKSRKYDWPKTVDEASDLFIKDLSTDERAEFAANNIDSLVEYHFTTGMYIRNEFGLWGENASLLKSCGVSHPDECSLVILELAWKKVRN